jgi:hypothetical protein
MIFSERFFGRKKFLDGFVGLSRMDFCLDVCHTSKGNKGTQLELELEAIGEASS